MKPLIVLTAFPQGWIGRERPPGDGAARVKTATALRPNEGLKLGVAPVYLRIVSDRPRSARPGRGKLQKSQGISRAAFVNPYRGNL